MGSSADKKMQRRQPQQPANPVNPWVQLRNDLDRNRSIYADLLGGKSAASDAEVDRFIMTCYGVVWHSPDLLEANRDSLLLAFAESAAIKLDLSPTAKEAYIEVRKGYARFATQYQGLVKLMHRGADIDYIYVDVVRKGDFFRKIGGSDPRIEHVGADLGVEPNDYDSDDAILAAYATVMLRGSTRPHFEVARRADFMKAKAMSKGPAWNQWFARMAMKVPLRRLVNLIPGADEARQVLAIEDSDSGGRVTTLPRVEEMLGINKGEPSELGPQQTDELRKLMASSGPSEAEPVEPPEEAR